DWSSVVCSSDLTNPSMNDTSGLLTQGFDREPSILMPYNPPYYEDYLLRFGFKRAMTMWDYYIHKKYVKLDKLRRGVELVQRRNPTIRLRPLDMSRYDEEARRSEEHTSELQSRENLVCRLLLE